MVAARGQAGRAKRRREARREARRRRRRRDAASSCGDGLYAIERRLRSTRRCPSAARTSSARSAASTASAQVTGFTAQLHRPAAEPRRAPAARPRDRRRDHLHRPLPDDRLGRPADQAGADERPRAQRDVRDPRPDLPGRPLRGPARLHEPGRARVDPAAAAVRGRLRALDRLRRLPALADQGGPRRRLLATARRSRSGSSAPAGS